MQAKEYRSALQPCVHRLRRLRRAQGADAGARRLRREAREAGRDQRHRVLEPPARVPEGVQLQLDHGRALPIASGLKLSRPDLTVVAVGATATGSASASAPAARHPARRAHDLRRARQRHLRPHQGPGLAHHRGRHQGEAGSGGRGRATAQPVLLVLSSGCGFVARSHAGNMPHLRQMFREAIQYPGFAFVHVLAACATYQMKNYARRSTTAATRCRAITTLGLLAGGRGGDVGPLQARRDLPASPRSGRRSRPRAWPGGRLAAPSGDETLLETAGEVEE